MGRHTGAVPGKAQMLLCSGLHIHPVRIRPKSCGEVRLHLRAVGAHLGGLGDEGGVDVHHGPSSLLQQRCHLPQQLQAGNTGVAGIAVREQLADVPQLGGAAEGVHYRVGQHVRVGVAQQPTVPGNLHAPQHQPPPLRQPVDVISMSDPQIRHIRSSLACRIASAKIRSTGVVIFRFSSSPSTR